VEFGRRLDCEYCLCWPGETVWPMNIIELSETIQMCIYFIMSDSREVASEFVCNPSFN
jgi:hypothetical protein